MMKNAWWFYMVGVAIFACRPTSSTTSSQRQPRQAQQQSNTPVTVTDLESHREIHDLHIDRDGKLTSALQPGHYAFAVTTDTSFAFFDRTLSIAEQFTVELSTACHRVRGRTVGPVTLPATVLMARLSTSTGDKFASAIRADGTFAACLPQGTYTTDVHGRMLSLNATLTIPSTSEIKLVTYPSEHIQQAPKGLHVSAVDRVSFVHSMGNRRIVGLGEANHGTGDFYRYREELSFDLARTNKVRTVLFEADAVGMMLLDDYVMGDNVEVEKAVVGLRFWITDIREFLTFLADIRSYNASVPRADRIRILGIDAQRVEPPVQFLLAHRGELSISEHEADLLSQIAPKHGVAFTTLPESDRQVLSTLLDRLADPENPVNLEGARTRGSIAARSIRYQLSYLNSSSERDQAMAGLAVYILSLDPTHQAVLWAHNGHIARQADGSTKSLGQYLSEILGADYYPTAFLSYEGAGRAWDRAGKIGVIAHALSPPPASNVESVIMNSTGFPDIAWVNLDTADAKLSRWLSLPRYVREFGSYYDPDDHQTLRKFPAAFSAVVVIRHASASTPTPTGVRRISK